MKDYETEIDILTNRINNLKTEQRNERLAEYAKLGIKVGALVSCRRNQVGKIIFIYTNYFPRKPDIKVHLRKKDGGWSKNDFRLYDWWDLIDED